MSSRSAVLRVLAATILWGTTGPIGALAHAPISPPALGATRILTGGLILLTWTTARHTRPVSPRHTTPGRILAAGGGSTPGRRRGGWPRRGPSGRILAGPFRGLAVGGGSAPGHLRGGWLRRGPSGRVLAGVRGAVGVGAVATGVFQVAYFTAVARVGAALATAIVFGVAPVGTGLWAWAAERAPLTGRWVVGTGCAIGGCGLLLLPAGPGQGDLVGVGLAVVAGVCYAAYTVAAGRFAGPGEGAAVVVTLVLGGLVGAPWLAAAGSGLLSWRTVLAVTWLGPVTTALAYMLFVRGLREVSAPTAGTLSLTEPLVAAVLGVGLLHERLTGPAVTGCLLLAAGLTITAVPVGSSRPSMSAR